MRTVHAHTDGRHDSPDDGSYGAEHLGRRAGIHQLRRTARLYPGHDRSTGSTTWGRSSDSARPQTGPSTILFATLMGRSPP